MKINKFDKAKLTKEKLKKFFSEKFSKRIADLTLRDIFNELKLTADDLSFLEIYLEELVKEGFVVRQFCSECGVYEYNPDWDIEY